MRPQQPQRLRLGFAGTPEFAAVVAGVAGARPLPNLISSTVVRTPSMTTVPERRSLAGVPAARSGDHLPIFVGPR